MKDKARLSKTFVTELDCLISIAKFLYRKDTDYSSSKNGFVDIPVIVKLKDLQTECRKSSKKEKPRVPFAERSVPWENLGELLDGLKSYADWTQYIPEGKSPRPRKERAIGIDLQRFLMVLFFVAIPPRRARTIRSLEVREVTRWEKVNTLERGIIEPGRGFVSARNLPEEAEARWFLRLRDYKTHKTYGDQDIEVTNYTFADGTSFYSYLALWLNKYRSLFEPVGDNLFVQVTNRSQLGQGLEASDFQSIVQRVTAKVLGVAITPKDFRHICSTYVMGRKDLSETERRAIAWAMGHSLDMQEGTYNQTSSDTYRETVRSCYQLLGTWNPLQGVA